MGIRIAIPLFGDDVAPRFCFTPRMLIAELEENKIESRSMLDVEGLRWRDRLEALARDDVQVIVCGGFNRRFLPYAEALGLQVVWGQSGEANEVLEALLRGDVMPNKDGTGPCEGRGQGRGRERCGDRKRDGSGQGRGPRGDGRGTSGRGQSRQRRDNSQ